MRQTIRIALAVFVGATALVSSAPSFRFSKAIGIGTAVREQMVLVNLDDDVYAATRDGYPDVRVLDNNGAEVPYLLERATEDHETVRQHYAVEVLSLKEKPDNRIEIHVRLHKDCPTPHGVRLITPLKDYERSVRVTGRDKDGTWTELTDDALIFDYTRFMDVSNSDVRLPVNRCRELRIEIDNVTDGINTTLNLLDRWSTYQEIVRLTRDVLERQVKIKELIFKLLRSEGNNEDPR